MSVNVALKVLKVVDKKRKELYKGSPFNIYLSKGKADENQKGNIDISLNFSYI